MSYQVALTICEQCGRGLQHGSGEIVDVDPEVTRSASETSTGAPRAHVSRATQDVPPAVRRAVLHRDGGRRVFPGTRRSRRSFVAGCSR